MAYEKEARKSSFRLVFCVIGLALIVATLCVTVDGIGKWNLVRNNTECICDAAACTPDIGKKLEYWRQAQTWLLAQDLPEYVGTGWPFEPYTVDVKTSTIKDNLAGVIAALEKIQAMETAPAGSISHVDLAEYQLAISSSLPRNAGVFDDGALNGAGFNFHAQRIDHCLWPALFWWTVVLWTIGLIPMGWTIHYLSNTEYYRALGETNWNPIADFKMLDAPRQHKKKGAEVNGKA